MVLFLARAEMFLFATASRQVLGPPNLLSNGYGKWDTRGEGAAGSRENRAYTGVKNTWNNVSIPPYLFMSRCFIPAFLNVMNQINFSSTYNTEDRRLTQRLQRLTCQQSYFVFGKTQIQIST